MIENGTDIFASWAVWEKEYGHDLNEILSECTFTYDNGKSEDCKTDFRWIYMEKFGNCYSWNTAYDSNGKKQSLKKSYHAGTGSFFKKFSTRGLTIFFQEFFRHHPNFFVKTNKKK